MGGLVDRDFGEKPRVPVKRRTVVYGMDRERRGGADEPGSLMKFQKRFGAIFLAAPAPVKNGGRKSVPEGPTVGTSLASRNKEFSPQGLVCS